MQFETVFDYFVYFIILIKIIFVISALGHLILSNTKTNPQLDKKLTFWKKQTEFIFMISMAVLLIYHFHPRLSKKPIGQETGLLFFLFGWILIITAEWSLFFEESPLVKKILNAFK